MHLKNHRNAALKFNLYIYIYKLNYMKYSILNFPNSSDGVQITQTANILKKCTKTKGSMKMKDSHIMIFRLH